MKGTVIMNNKILGKIDANETLFFDFAFKNDHLVGVRKLTEEEHNEIVAKEKAEELAAIERNRKLTFKEKIGKWIAANVTPTRLAGCGMIMLGTILTLLDMGEGVMFAGLGICSLLIRLPENL